ncbi:MAG: MoxR family ATPase [Deltaproteobacteria bacterium]|nr:MAG: MoxR family ATPase [Deltaproteobacteria bacterium]
MHDRASSQRLTEKPDDLATVAEIARKRDAIKAELAKVIIGQEAVIDQLLIALFSRGHCFFIGVPGLGKTLLVSTLSRVLSLAFNRIQFTPDLMPSDITGTDILEEDHTTGKRFFKFIRGPVFCNLLLADEINRTPPKTQAALLQAMQEYKVTAGGKTYPLERPFHVFATQNPIEQEGTYPLPEALLDRFMLNIDVSYPSFTEEIEVVTKTTGAFEPELTPVLSPAEILRLQELVLRVPIAQHVVRYAVDLVRHSRPDDENAPEFVREWVAWGASPRASQFLVLGAKARAVLRGNTAASCNDVRALAHPVLQHRIMPNFHAEAEGITARKIIDRLLTTVSEPSPQ